MLNPWEQGALDALHEAKRAIDVAIADYESARTDPHYGSEDGPLFSAVAACGEAADAINDFLSAVNCDGQCFFDPEEDFYDGENDREETDGSS